MVTCFTIASFFSSFFAENLHSHTDHHVCAEQPAARTSRQSGFRMCGMSSSAVCCGTALDEFVGDRRAR